MDRDGIKEALQKMDAWDGELDEDSPAELFTFVFTKKKDYDKFCEELVDKKNYRLSARFEEQ